MASLKSQLLLRLISIGFLLILPQVVVLSQDDPDPNSPTPILLSMNGSTRALATPVGKARAKTLDRLPAIAFTPDSVIELFVANLALMPGEGANAFRVYAEDVKGRTYRFPVLDLRRHADTKRIHVLKVQLTDDLRFWEAPKPDGDLLIAVTWRGLSSNRVRLGYGRIGGTIKDDKGAVPTPLSRVEVLTAKSDAVATPEAVGYRWSGDRMRFLQQATFGATPELDNRIRRIGLRTYLAEQFEAPYPSSANPYPNIPLKNTDANNATNGCGMFATSPVEFRICLRDHYSMYPVQTWFFREAFYGEPQLRHRVAWALSQIWVISGVDTQQSSWMLAYHKVLSQHAFGNYRDLMKDMTLNPGMGNFLDMARSTRNNPNENYAREILQLFTIGLFMLNQDGTLQRDGQGEPIPTYDQDDVNNFTKVLTGWTFCNVGCSNSLPGIVNYKDPLVLNNNNHDLTAKTLLSYPGSTTSSIAACTGCTGTAIASYANNSFEQTMDNIFHHPNVAPFVSRQLIQHLVTSDPTPAYVGRIAAVFNNNGFGVRGDLKSVVRAILLDPEARGDVKTDPNFGKLREPVQLVTNMLKALGVRSADGSMPSDGFIPTMTTMAQNPFNAPTVFNYYPPDYVIPGTAINAPEFGIMTTSTSIARANFANTMAFATIPVSQDAPQGTSINLSELQALAAADPTGNQLLDALNYKMLHNTMSAEMRASILPAVTALPVTDPLGRARAAVYLVATSSQFQVQR